MLPDSSSSPLQWKDFLALGEELLKQPDTITLCQFFESVVNDRLLCSSQVWLAEPFYPLPGEKPVDTIPNEKMPELVGKVFDLKIPIHSNTNAPAGSIQSPNALYLPLITQGNLLGVLSAIRESPLPFEESEIRQIEGMAAYAAVAMQVNRQVAIKNWRYDQISLVRSVSAQIANVLDLDELCRRVTSLIQCSFDFYHVAIFTIEEGKKELRFRASSLECEPSVENALSATKYGVGLIGNAAKSGKEILVQDVTKEPRFRYIENLPKTKAEAVLPLIVENRILGVLDLQSERKEAFHENDMLVIRALADNIALAVESAHLFSRLEQRAAQLAAVADIGYALSSILELDKLLNEVVSVIHRQFDIPFVHIFTVHAERRKIIYQAGSGIGPKRLKPNSLAFELDASSGIIPHVARSGTYLLANDVLQEPLFKPYKNFPEQVKSELAIPLNFGTDVLGILDLQSDQVDRFSSEDVELFESLATGIALALRNATLFKSEKWRRRVADSFQDIAGLLSSNLALGELLDRVLLALETNLPCDASAIWLLDDLALIPVEDRKLRLAAVRGAANDSVISCTFESEQVRSFLHQGIKSNQVQIRQPGDPYGPLGAARKFKTNYSSLMVPLRSGDETIGVLTLAHRARGRYGIEASSIASTLANYAAVAIQNARLYTTAQEEAWSSTVLLQVAEAVQSITTVDALFSTLVRLTPLLVGIDHCAIYQAGFENDSFELKKWYGFQPDEDELQVKEMDSLAFLKLRATMAPVFIQNPLVELGLHSLRHQPDTGTLVLLPLLAHGELQGGFLVSHNSKGEFGVQSRFSDQTLAILQGITQQTAMGLENIRLLESRQEEAYITAVLLQVAQAVVSQNELDDILDTIVQLMPILAGVDLCVIYLWDEENQVFRPAKAAASNRQDQEALLQKSYVPGEFKLLDESFSTDMVGACRLNSDEILVESWHELDCIQDEKELLSGVSSWLLGIPLGTKSEKIGVFLTRETNAQPAYHQKRIELIRGVAQQTTLAIQNEKMKQEMVTKKRIEQEFLLARQIQKTFLPQSIPEAAGWDLNLRWRTAREVGGDFYDLFITRDNQIGIVIADVSDKGMPAALYMTVTRTLIRSAAQSQDSPAEVLRRVNELLEMDSQNGMFVTAIYALLNPKTGILTYANAGHNLPLLLRGLDQKIEKLEKGSIALGVIPDARYKDCQVTLQQADTLLFYTDGVTEAFSISGELFSEARLLDSLQTSKFSSASDLLEKIEDLIIEFRNGEPPSDDLTMIALRRKK